MVLEIGFCPPTAYFGSIWCSQKTRKRHIQQRRKTRISCWHIQQRRKTVFRVLTLQSPTKKTNVTLFICFIQYIKLRAYIPAFIMSTQPWLVVFVSSYFLRTSEIPLFLCGYDAIVLQEKLWLRLWWLYRKNRWWSLVAILCKNVAKGTTDPRVEFSLPKQLV